MIDLQDRSYCPTLEEIGEYVNDPVFHRFCSELKEKEPFEAILPECTSELKEIYFNTREGNGQKWLMVKLEDMDDMYHDVLRIIELRRTCQLSG